MTLKMKNKKYFLKKVLIRCWLKKGKRKIQKKKRKRQLKKINFERLKNHGKKAMDSMCIIPLALEFCRSH